MNFLRNFIMLGIAGAMFTACGDEPEVKVTKEETIPLELSKSELNFSETAQSEVITVTTSELWVAETPAEWLLVSPSSGDGTGSVTVSVTENDSDVSRESYVNISTASETKVLVVVQLADENEGGDDGGNDTEGNVTIENGAIKAAFSISDSEQIYFSQGNLQYQASTGTWRFAEHQYDMIGNANADISSSYSGWIDLFGWGTSGWNSGANAYQPYSTSTDYDDYYVGGDKNNDLTGSYANADWGVYNKISNGGNSAGMWRTLTIDEWNYVISGRAQASRLKGQGRVNNVNGLILLPDGWETPSSVKITYDPGNYSTNVYSLDEWSVLESYGAVFLPAAGDRYGTDVSGVGSYGSYWSGSTYDSYNPIYLYFNSNDVSTYNYDGNYGRSVRLVRGL